MRAGEVSSNIQLHIRSFEPSRGEQLYLHFFPALWEGMAGKEQRSGQDKLDWAWRQEPVPVIM